VCIRKRIEGSNPSFSAILIPERPNKKNRYHRLNSARYNSTMKLKDELDILTQHLSAEDTEVVEKARQRILYLEEVVRKLQRDAHMNVHIKLCADALADA